MSSFRRLALLLALGLPVMPVLVAQNSSSSSNPAPSNQDQARQSTGLTPQQMSVQARVRARRAQRRATVIQDTYGHLYEAYLNMGYLRFVPGPALQHLTYSAWDIGITRFFNERLSATVDGRGYYGTAYVGLNKSNITRPSVSTYAAMAGPGYRFYMQPKYAVSGRVMAGYAHGIFSGDTNGLGTLNGVLYPNSSTFAASTSVLGDWNIAPNVSIRVAPEVFFTGFGSKVQYSRGFTSGIVYRFGRQ
jgi:hypothetical protein